MNTCTQDTTAKTWTDQDVQRLVETATHLFNNKEAWDRLSHEHQGWAAMSRLGDALAPFQPDPDADLIEAMAKAGYEAVYIHSYDGLTSSTIDAERKRARAALAAYRAHTKDGAS